MMQKNNHRANVVRAEATTVVRSYKPTIYDHPDEGPALANVQLEEDFEGDIRAKGMAGVLQAISKDGSIHFVAIERVVGELADKKGSFLLQVTGTVTDKVMRATWLVVPHSGTATLTGLHGEGGFRATLGKSGHATLDYWFE